MTFDRSTDERLLQLANAPTPMYLSAYVGANEVRPVFSNASAPIFSTTFESKSTVLSCVQSLNAPLPMHATLDRVIFLMNEL